MRVIAWQDRMMKSDWMQNRLSWNQREKHWVFCKEYTSFLCLGFFFRSQKADITFVAGRKRKQVFMTRFGALCIKTDCQNPPPWCLFSSKALLCCLGNQHTRPVLMTGTPGIWSYCCYLSLLNTNQGIARVHPTLCLYKALNYFFFPLVRLSGNAWHSVSGAPCSNGWDADVPFKALFLDGAGESTAQSWRTIVCHRWYHGKLTNLQLSASRGPSELPVLGQSCLYHPSGIYSGDN